jgi:hypothetical protein
MGKSIEELTEEMEAKQKAAPVTESTPATESSAPETKPESVPPATA